MQEVHADIQFKLLHNIVWSFSQISLTQKNKNKKMSDHTQNWIILFATVCVPSVALSAFIQVIDEDTNLICRTTICLLENPNKKSASPALPLTKKIILHLKTSSCQTWYMFVFFLLKQYVLIEMRKEKKKKVFPLENSSQALIPFLGVTTTGWRRGMRWFYYSLFFKFFWCLLFQNILISL